MFFVGQNYEEGAWKGGRGYMMCLVKLQANSDWKISTMVSQEKVEESG